MVSVDELLDGGLLDDEGIGGALNVELLDDMSLDDEGIGGILKVELLDGGLLEDEGIGGTLKVELLEGRSLDDEGVGGTLNVELLDGGSLDDVAGGGTLNVELLDGMSLDDELLEGKSPEDDTVSEFPVVVTLLELDVGLANKSLELLSCIIESLDDELIGGSSLNEELLEGKSLDNDVVPGFPAVSLLELDDGLAILLDELAMTAVESLELLSSTTESFDDELLGSGSLDDELLEGNSLEDDVVAGFPSLSLLLLDDGFAILLDELAMTAVESLELLSGTIESLDDELLRSIPLELLLRQLQSCHISGPMIVPTGNVISRNA